MELDTPMVGLDPGGEIQFQAGSCTVAEMIRYQSGKCTEYTTASLKDEDIGSWAAMEGTFSGDDQSCGRVRFATSSTTGLDPESSGETLELNMSRETFSHLADRYRFSQALDAWRHRAMSGSAIREVQFDDDGKVQSVVLTFSIRISGSFASIVAINHDFRSNSTVALGLRVSLHDQTLIQEGLEKHNDLIGHALFVPTVLVETSLSTNMLFMQTIRQELSVIEKATGQHSWLKIPASDAPAHDSELSRLGHATKIHISVSHRRIESIACYVDLIKQTYSDLEQQIMDAFVCTNGQRDRFLQWIGDLEMTLKFRQVDLKYSERRADNQITAIYGLLSQRDNMIGVSVAMESKKISEASKRDGSALKSLTVLTAVFFPATYIATLFALPTFSGTPFWAYWVVVIPLTLIIFGFWSCWTFYRQHMIAKETRRETVHDAGLDPEPTIPTSKGNSVALSLIGPTLHQIRLHTKHLDLSNSEKQEIKG